MTRVVITISLDPEFIDKFIGFLKNLAAVNSDKRAPMKIDSIEIDDNFVAYPEENKNDRET